MAGYVVLECKDCWHKEIYPIRTADGKRCGKCGSGLFISIDAGNKKEMMLKHIPPRSKKSISLANYVTGGGETAKTARRLFRVRCGCRKGWGVWPE